MWNRINLKKNFFLPLFALIVLNIGDLWASISIREFDLMALAQGGSGSINIIVDGASGRDTVFNVTFSNPGITVNSVTTLFFDNSTSSATVTVDISVASDAPIGKGDFTITDVNKGQGSATADFYVTPSYPSITAVDPEYIQKGQDVTLNIFGSGFTDASSVEISNCNTYNIINILGDTQISVDIPGTDTSGKETGQRDIKITLTDGTTLYAAGILMITEPPTVTNINPSQVTQGASQVWITVTGSNFLNGAWPSFSGGGIYISADPNTGDPLVEFINSNQIKFAIDIDVGAPIGKRTLTITNPDGSSGSLEDALEVIELAEITSVEPSSILTPSQDKDYTIRVLGKGFREPISNVYVGGFSIVSSNLISSTELQITFTVTASTNIGYRDISFTNGDGTLVLGPGKLLISAVPEVTSIAPNQVTQGASGIWVDVYGNNFINGAVPTFSGAGITVANDAETGQPLINYIDATHIKFAIDVNEGAPIGKRTLTITNPDGSSGSLDSTDPNAFEVIEFADISSIEPNSVTKPDSGTKYYTLRILGQGFIYPVRFEIGHVTTQRNVYFDDATYPIYKDTDTFVSELLRSPQNDFNDSYAHYNYRKVISYTPQLGDDYYTVEVGTGVFINDITFIGSTEVDFQIGLTSSQSPKGYVDLKMYNGDGTVLTKTLEIKSELKIISISPTKVVQGERSKAITLTGQGFKQGFTASVSNGITVNGVNYLNENQVEIYVSVPDNATLGIADIVVWNPDGKSYTFSGVEVQEALKVTEVEPIRLGLGTTGSTITIRGSNFVSTPTVKISGTGVTVGGVKYIGSTELQAWVTVNVEASIGYRNVEVTNPSSDGRSGVGENLIEIYNPVKVSNVYEKSTNLSILVATSTSTNYTLKVIGEGFESGAQVNISGDGITVNNPATVISATELEVGITIDSTTATPGARDVEVVNANGTRATGNGIIEVVKPLRLSSVNPNEVGTGAAGVWVKIYGDGIINGANVDISGGGINITDTLYVSRNEIDIKINVAETASEGSRDITVINPDGQIKTLSGALGIVVKPVVNSVTPVSLSQGAKEQWITIVGANFSTSCVVDIGDGVNISSIVYESGTGNIKVEVNVDDNASVGARNVVVTDQSTGKSGLGVGVFEIESKLVITEITPSGLSYGLSNRVLTVNGSNFKSGINASFVSDTSSTESVSGITINSLTYYSSTNLEINVSIGQGVASGVYYLRLENPDRSYNTKIFNILTPPSVVNVTPDKVMAGTTGQWVTIQGGGFTGDSRVSFSGTGVSVSKDRDGNELIISSSTTQIRVAIDVAEGTPPGYVDVIVTNPDGTIGVGNDKLQIVKPLVITSVEPATMIKGSKGWVSLKGDGITEGSELGVSVSGGGVSISSVTHLGSTEIRFWIEISTSAIPGSRDILLTNGDGSTLRVSGLFNIEVPVEITSISPEYGFQGESNKRVVIFGSHFQEGAVVSFNTNGIVVNDVKYKSEYSMEAYIDISFDIAPGKYNIKVINPDKGEDEVKEIFEVFEPVEVLKVLPIKIGKGVENYEIKITGNNFDDGATVSISGNGVTVDNTSVKVISKTELTVNVSVDVDATSGLRDVTVTNPNGNSGTGKDLIEIFDAVKIQSVLEKENGLTSLVRGNTYWMRIRGEGFLPDPVVSFGSDVIVSSTNYMSDSEIEVLVDISSTASVGTRDLVIINIDGTKAKLYGAIDIIKPLVLSRIKPESVGAGAEGYLLRIFGEGIMEDSIIKTDSDYVSIKNKSFISQSEVDVTVDVDELTPVGSVNIIVTNKDGQSKSLEFFITVQPVINKISPYELSQGAQGQWLTITGNNFFSSSTVNMGEGINVTSFTYTSTRQIKVKVDVDKKANIGSRDVMVLNPDGKFGIGVEKFQVVEGPYITEVEPYELIQGMENKTLFITGNGFKEGLSLSFGEAGFNVDKYKYVNSKTIEVTLDVPREAVLPGSYDVYIVNPDSSSASLKDAIVVKEGPTILDVVPNVLITGTENQLTVKGINFNNSSIVNIPGLGLEITGTSFVDETTIMVAVSIKPDAPSGNRSLYLITPEGVNVVKEDAITIVPPLQVKEVSKKELSQGEEAWISIKGDGFIEGAKISLTGEGLIIDTYTFVSSNEIKVKLKVSLEAEVGDYDISVVNPDGSSYLFSGAISVKSLDFENETYVYPSPVKKGIAYFRTIIKSDAEVEIKVYDVMGRKVFEDKKQGVSGENVWQWNCVDENGVKLGSGIYIYQIKADYGDKIEKVIKKLVIVGGK